MNFARETEEIVVFHGAIKQIAADEEVKANIKTVADALKRPRNTKLHKKIREVALRKYNGHYRSDEFFKF